jgi:hypothetical protein
MDGRRVQFKDVAVRLRGYGIDLTNGRFLILQASLLEVLHTVESRDEYALHRITVKF